ncbi:DNA damage-inducible protein D [Myroides odoratimimus]|uniref:DNA damage-inducible protein D n=1 Tax=Myroides odoratimimus TaxID=76832 RepID=UPI002DBF6E9E|nr:DNA damage-inducible protein D [Myroides odoratimimus]MEC4085376.1 DNA damage-inducible protein D [Myroides odoratimimus]
MGSDMQNINESLFEQIRQIDEAGNEYWSARQFAKVIEYVDFRNFERVLNKAKQACENSGYAVADHIVDFNEMVSIGSGAVREMPSYKLSRYACYLVVQNADPSKEIVAQGQTYFAVQTRIQEIRQMDEYANLSTEDERRLFLRNELVKHNTQLAAAAKDAGVIKPIDYAIFQNHGYKGLYGGLDAKAIHKKKGLSKSQQILDHMGSTELAANLFRATQTEDKLRREDIQGKAKANETHYEVGAKVRKTIEELGGMMPEDLPTVESVKKIEKQQTKMLNKKKDNDE